MIWNSLEKLGFVVLRKSLKFSLNDMQSYFDDACEKSTGTSFRNVTGNITPPPVSPGIEASQTLFEALHFAGLQRSLRLVFNDSVLFWGSSLNCFRGPSTWHRDIVSDIPFYKCLIYLGDSYEEDQCFHLLPGTQLVLDKYALGIHNSMQKGDAGINAEVFYSEIDIESQVKRLCVPAHDIRIAQGDIIIFDQRLLHAVTAGPQSRRLIAMTFVPNYITINSVSEMSTYNEVEYTEKLIKIMCSSFLVEMHSNKREFCKTPENLEAWFWETYLGKIYAFRNIDQDSFKTCITKDLGGNVATAEKYINEFYSAIKF